MSTSKTLLVGLTKLSGVKCVEWTDLLEIPNLALYQRVVVVEPTLVSYIERLRSVYESGPNDEERASVTQFGSNLAKGLKLAKGKFCQILRAGGEIYAIVAPYRHFYGDAKYGPAVASDEWHPLPFSLQEEHWDQVTVEDEAFAKHFAIVESGTHSFKTRYSPMELEHLVSQELEPKPEPRLLFTSLATDWQTFPLAARLRFGLGRATPSDHFSKYESENYLSSGGFVLLPAPRQERLEEAVSRLLVDFCKIQPSTVDPVWFDSISLPGEEEARTAVEMHRKTIAEAQESLNQADARLRDATRFKRLLSEKGHPLQELVRTMFGELGFETPDSPVSDEFLLQFDGETMLVEVTGSDKSIATRDLSQLIKDLGKYLEATGVPVKGLFVANPWRLTAPHERNSKDRPTFPDDLKKTAVTFSVSLLDCMELLDIYRMMRSGSMTPAEIFTALSSTSGIVHLSKGHQAVSPGHG